MANHSPATGKCPARNTTNAASSIARKLRVARSGQSPCGVG